MFLEYTPEQQALRKELREYFAQLLTPAVRAELGEPGEGSPLFRDVVRQIGTDGWLGIGWPQESHDHALRQRRAEVVLPARDPRR
jgi:alkylation response protein AidB-like acyl-CoA dehydrogenase